MNVDELKEAKEERIEKRKEAINGFNNSIDSLINSLKEMKFKSDCTDLEEATKKMESIRMSDSQGLSGKYYKLISLSWVIHSESNAIDIVKKEILKER